VAGGTRDFERLIQRADEVDPKLSFDNLIEAHALRALRSKYSVPMKAIRTALDYAEARCGFERLLLSDELRAIPGEVLLQRLDEIINIGRGGQEVIKEILATFLQRVDRGDKGAPLRLSPLRVLSSRSPHTSFPGLS
jgi:hypothetical protein